MRFKLAVVFIFIMAGGGLYAQKLINGELNNHVYILPKVNPNILIVGTINGFKETLVPKPDSTELLFFGFDFNLRFNDYFGLYLGADLYGPMNVFKQNYARLTIAYLNNIDAGLLLYLPVFRDKIKKAELELDLKFNLGLNGNLFTFSPAYKDLLKPYLVKDDYGIGLGVVGGLAIEFKYDLFVVGIGGNLAYSTFDFANASTTLDSLNVEIPIYVGITF